VGRPSIGTQAMTAAGRQRRHRAAHGPRKPDPTNAARQQRWRDRRADEVVAEVKVARAAQAAAALDPLFIQAAAILEGRGETDLVARLRTTWAYMTEPVRREMAAGRGFRFWLRD
jgi:hypothetical protein